jgi:hypothetical protein
MRRTFLGMLAIHVLVTLAFASGGQGQTNASVRTNDLRPATVAPAAAMTIRPVPPEVAKRAETLRASLQPSARSWIEQQAQVEAKRPVPNPDALRAAIRQRFAPSLSQGAARQGGIAAGQIDIDAVVMIVMEQAAQDSTQDLQAQMQQMQDATKEKQALRQLADEMQQAKAQMASAMNAVCKTAFCQSLPARLNELNRSSAGLPHPTHLQAPSNITGQQLAALDAQLKQAGDSVSEMSDQLQLELQMSMDARSKALEALSNIEKSESDAQNSIVQNLK